MQHRKIYSYDGVKIAAFSDSELLMQLMKTTGDSSEEIYMRKFAGRAKKAYNQIIDHSNINRFIHSLIMHGYLKKVKG